MNEPTTGRSALRVIVEADGGSRGNPGPAGFGAVVRTADTGAVLAERKEAIGVETNNVAEYRGLIAGLAAAKELGATAVQVRLDSKLLVEQMSGRWQVKHPSLRPLARQASQLAGSFGEISFSWIPRAQNSHADRLANEAMDAAAGRPVTAKPAEPVRQMIEPSSTNFWVPPDTTPTRLVLLRHGVTQHSVEKRFAGRSDLELTEAGLDQAIRAAGRITDFGPIDAVISSPLRRTRQTAQAVADAVSMSVQVEEGVVEADFGIWDGFTYAEISDRWPTELQAWLADPAVAPPSGESFDAVTRRVRRARDRIIAEHVGNTVVVVSHVSPIKTLVRLALDAPPSAVHRMFLQPASISVIDYFTDGPTSLLSFNDAAHLAAGSVR